LGTCRVQQHILQCGPAFCAGTACFGSGRLALADTGREAVSTLCRGKAAVGVSMWMRVLLPQVLGPESGAFPSDGDEISSAAISRLSNSGATAALDMLDIAMAPGGANGPQDQCTSADLSPENLADDDRGSPDLCTLIRARNSLSPEFRSTSLLPTAKCYCPCGFRVSRLWRDRRSDPGRFGGAVHAGRQRRGASHAAGDAVRHHARRALAAGRRLAGCGQAARTAAAAPAGTAPMHLVNACTPLLPSSSF